MNLGQQICILEAAKYVCDTHKWMKLSVTCAFICQSLVYLLCKHFPSICHMSDNIWMLNFWNYMPSHFMFTTPLRWTCPVLSLTNEGTVTCWNSQLQEPLKPIPSDSTAVLFTGTVGYQLISWICKDVLLEVPYITCWLAYAPWINV